MSTTSLTIRKLPSEYIGLRGKVLAYVGDNAAGGRFAQYADGLVFHGRAGFREAPRYAGRSLCVIDPALYKGDRGHGAGARLFSQSPTEAVQAQVHAGADCLLAPSRFPLERDAQTINALLMEGESFISAARLEAPPLPAFVPVVIRFDELADGRWDAPIRSSGLPIAPAFAGYGDPLATPPQLEGAIRVVAAAEISFVLRYDTSAIGLMALEATAGSIGTSSSARHLWLPTRHSRTRSPSRSLFVPRFANWMKVEFIERSAADPDLDDLFRCDCPVCGPQGDVRRLVEADDEMQDDHSIASAVRLAHEVLEADDPTWAWRTVCQSAVDAYDELEWLGISGPAKSGALKAWLSVLG